MNIWSHAKVWEPDIVRFVAARNHPETGTLVVTCIPDTDTPRQFTALVLSALHKQRRSTTTGRESRHLAAVWCRAYGIRQIVLLGAHRVGPRILPYAAKFAEDVEADLTFVTYGELKRPRRVVLEGLCNNAPADIDAVLERLSAVPAEHAHPYRHPADSTPAASAAFDSARRVLATTLPILPTDRDTWFAPLTADTRASRKAADAAHGLLQAAAHHDLHVIVATKRGALAGAALQGWAWDLDDATGCRARTPGAEHWPALCRYQRPEHAATVVLAALGISPETAVGLSPEDVTTDGQFVLAQSDSPVAVIAPPARRALTAQASVAVEPSFLSIYGRPMSISVATDIVRRSMGVLGNDLVTATLHRKGLEYLTH